MFPLDDGGGTIFRSWDTASCLGVDVCGDKEEQEKNLSGALRPAKLLQCR